MTENVNYDREYYDETIESYEDREANYWAKLTEELGEGESLSKEDEIKHICESHNLEAYRERKDALYDYLNEREAIKERHNRVSIARGNDN